MIQKTVYKLSVFIHLYFCLGSGAIPNDTIFFYKLSIFIHSHIFLGSIIILEGNKPRVISENVRKQVWI